MELSTTFQKTVNILLWSDVANGKTTISCTTKKRANKQQPIGAEVQGERAAFNFQRSQNSMKHSWRVQKDQKSGSR